MASGLPVIGTRTRGIADAVGDEAGWLVPRDDAAALASAIDTAVANRAEAARRGELGRYRAEREFALPRILDAYDALYTEALALPR
jgi:glycosyltransferase involved in cell wall biosynthesis